MLVICYRMCYLERDGNCNSRVIIRESDGCISLRSFLTVVTDQGGVFLPCRGGGGGVGARG